MRHVVPSALNAPPGGALVVGTPCRSYGYAASFRLVRTAPPTSRWRPDVGDTTLGVVGGVRGMPPVSVPGSMRV